jgi:hypothetical protein
LGLEHVAALAQQQADDRHRRLDARDLTSVAFRARERHP